MPMSPKYKPALTVLLALLLAGCLFFSALSLWDTFNPSPDSDGLNHFVIGVPFYLGTIALSAVLVMMYRRPATARSPRS